MARSVEELLLEVPRYLAEQLRERKIGRRKLLSEMDGWNTGEAKRVERAVRAGTADLSVCIDEDPPEEEIEVDPNQYITDDRYFYNDRTERHVFLLRSAPKPVVLPDETLKGMKRAYSNWSGQQATINELCRNYEIPRGWFTEIKQILGWTHDSEPFTEDELLEKDEDELVQEALQMRRSRIYRKFEQQKYRDTEKTAEKWREFERYVFRPLQELISEQVPIYEPPEVHINTSAGDPHAFIPAPMDLHYGKHGWADETGTSYSREEARELVISRTQELIGRVSSQKIDRIILPVGSDWFHVDTYQGETTLSTNQDVDGTPAQIIQEGSNLAITVIDVLRGIEDADVEVYVLPGNHDRQQTIGLGMYLEAWYRQDKDITVDREPTTHKYFTYGQTVGGFTHGDRRPKKNELPLQLAQKVRPEWGQTTHALWITGHKHVEELRNYGGVFVYQVPSLSGTDRFHERNSYDDGRRGLAGCLLHHEKGPVTSVVAPV